MYDASSIARRLVFLLGVNPSKKPMLRTYLQEAYNAGLVDGYKIDESLVYPEDDFSPTNSETITNIEKTEAF